MNRHPRDPEFPAVPVTLQQRRPKRHRPDQTRACSRLHLKGHPLTLEPPVKPNSQNPDSAGRHGGEAPPCIRGIVTRNVPGRTGRGPRSGREAGKAGEVGGSRRGIGTRWELNRAAGANRPGCEG